MKLTTALPILALLALTTALPLSRRHASPQDADVVSELLAEMATAEQDNSELAAAQILADMSSQQRGGVGKRSPVPQDLSAELAAEELAAQNEMQTQTTEEEFAQEMNDAAWKTASGAASDQIQKRQFTGAESEEQQQEDAELAELQTQEAQIEAEEAAAQQNAQSTYQQVDSQNASEFSKRSAQWSGNSAAAQAQADEEMAEALAREQQIAAEEAVALSNSQTTYQQADGQASSEFSR